MRWVKKVVIKDTDCAACKKTYKNSKLMKMVDPITDVIVTAHVMLEYVQPLVIVVNVMSKIHVQKILQTTIYYNTS